MSGAPFAQAQASLGRSVVRCLSNAYAVIGGVDEPITGIYVNRLVEVGLGGLGSQQREISFEHLAEDLAEPATAGDEVTLYTDDTLATVLGEYNVLRPERNAERGSVVLLLEEGRP